MARRLIRRFGLLFVEFLAGLTAGVAILALAGIWFLSSGPVSLSFLTPYIEQALAPQDSAVAVEIDDTVLTWSGWDRAVDVQVNNMRVLDLDRRVVAAMPQVSLGFSLNAMLRGLVAPTYIEILRPRVVVARDRNGRFSMGIRHDLELKGGAERPEDIVLPNLIAELLAEANTARPLGYLRRVGIVDGDLTLQDLQLGRTWRAPRADIALVRNETGINAEFALDLEMDGKRSTVIGDAAYLSADQTIETTLEFAQVDPTRFLPAPKSPLLKRVAALQLKLDGKISAAMTIDGLVRQLGFDVAGEAGTFKGDMSFDATGYAMAAKVNFDSLGWPTIAAVLPDLAAFAEADLPVAGSISFQGTTDGQVLSLDFDVTGGAGTVALPRLYDDPVRVAGLKLRGTASGNFRRVQFSEASVKLPEGEVVTQASISRVGRRWTLRFDGTATDIAIPMLKTYWPKQAAADARKWILLNVEEGTISEANLSLVARITDDDDTDVRFESLHGGIRVEGGSVNYYHPMSRVTAVSADMTFTEEGFDIVVGSGRLRDLVVDSGSVVVSKMDTEDPQISIDLTVRGPLQTALGVIDEPPLRFISKFGMDPAVIRGQSATRLVFEFPLAKSLEASQIALAAGATVRNVSVENGPLGLAVGDGSLKLQITGRGMTAEGSASLNGVPVTVDWHEKFTNSGKFQRRVKISGLADNAAREALKLPGMPFLDGDVPTDIVYTKSFAAAAEVVVRSDVGAAALDFPSIRWRKQPGTPGTLNAFAVIPEDGAPIIEELRLDTGDMRVNARIQLTPDATDVTMLEFRELAFAGNQLRGRVAFAGDKGVEIDLTGARANVADYMRSETEVDAGAGIPPSPIRLRAHIDEVILGDGQLLQDVKAALVGDGANWRSVDIDAAVSDSARLAVSYGPDGDGAALRVATQNAGATLRALGMSEGIFGGALLITGRQSSPGTPMSGTFSIKKFKASKAPVLARVLQVLSLTGIFTALSQQGLDFAALDGSFRYFGGALEISNTRAIGSSIGVTTEGVIFVDSDTARLNGTVVPAYTINQVLGKIPILGKILTGGKNEGLFAANYAVRGRLEDPKVTVNPLSALAPGFLRIFVSEDVKPIPKEDRQPSSQ